MISMIRNKYLTLIGVGLLFTAVSCTDGYEPEPVELVSIDFVFSKTDSLGTNAVKFMNNIYATLQNGHNRVGSDYLDAASDDAISINVSDPDVYKLAMGRILRVHVLNRICDGKSIIQESVRQTF